MHIEHIAIWTNQLEVLKEFYLNYFNAKTTIKYHNPTNDFTSYFLTFEKGARLELMQMPNISAASTNIYQQFTGLTHFSVAVGSKERVDSMTEKFRKDGFEVVGEPRTTGDGYYESVILDPDNNRIEITI